MISNFKTALGSVHDFGISDHKAQTLELKLKVNKATMQWFEVKRDLSTENMLRFWNYIISLSFNEILEERDTNIAFSNFHETIILFLIRAKITVKHNKWQWITKGIKRACHKKRILYNIYRNSNIRYKHLHKQKYKMYSKVLRRCILKGQKINIDNKIVKAKNKTKAVWSIIDDT